MRIFFNMKTGLLQGAFEGELVDNGVHYHIYHAVFYQQVNIKTGTNAGGRLVISTAPEPSSLWLLATGLVALLGRRFV